MERVKLTQPKAAGMGKQNDSGFAIRSLPVNKQFLTKSCVRCGGPAREGLDLRLAKSCQSQCRESSLRAMRKLH